MGEATKADVRYDPVHHYRSVTRKKASVTVSGDKAGITLPGIVNKSPLLSKPEIAPSYRHNEV